jgi:hypothetical protein
MVNYVGARLPRQKKSKIFTKGRGDPAPTNTNIGPFFAHFKLENIRTAT